MENRQERLNFKRDYSRIHVKSDDGFSRQKHKKNLHGKKFKNLVPESF